MMIFDIIYTIIEKKYMKNDDNDEDNFGYKANSNEVF